MLFLLRRDTITKAVDLDDDTHKQQKVTDDIDYNILVIVTFSHHNISVNDRRYFRRLRTEAPHRTAPHRIAPYRTVPHCTVPHSHNAHTQVDQFFKREGALAK